jgi:hypothetical protein
MMLLGKIALGVGGMALASAGVLCSEGMVHVKVMEKQPQGVHINVIAPAMLAPIAVHLAPQRSLAEAARKIQPQLPVIRAALESLSDSEDIVLVEVTEPDQHVRVAKERGSIVVDVDDVDDTVHVATPIRAVSQTIDALAAEGAN